MTGLAAGPERTNCRLGSPFVVRLLTRGLLLGVMLLLLADVVNGLRRRFDELPQGEKRSAASRLRLLGKPVLDHPTVPAVEGSEDVRRHGRDDDPTNGLDHGSP